MTEIVRARVAHTPRDPFGSPGGAYSDVRGGHPEAEVLDARDTILPRTVGRIV
jgi:hypothetical protein